MTWLLMLAASLTAGSVTAQTLVFITPPQVLPFGRPSSALVVERRTAGGAPETSGTLSVQFGADSAMAQFAGTPLGPTLWGPTFTVDIPDGSSRSPPVYFRHATVGPTTVTVGATGHASASQVHQVVSLGFADDFETGGLFWNDTPPGRWDEGDGDGASTATVSPLAAHRGAWGLRVVDPTTPNGFGGVRRMDQGTAQVGTLHYARFWMRVADHNDQGDVMFAMTWSNGSDSAAELRLNNPGLRLGIAGFESTGLFFYSPAPGAQLETGRWHLFEYEASGFQTSAGRIRLWVDGSLAHTVENLDWSTKVGWPGSIGAIWSDDRTLLATLDFDDYRVSATPPASRLQLESSASGVTQGACVPLTVGLVDSVTGTAAAAPYDVDVALTSTGVPGTFYTDAACTTSTPGPTIPAGATITAAYFQPSAGGTAQLSAEQPDFLTAQAQVSLTVTPLEDAPTTPDDTSPDGAPVSLRLGCAAAPAPMGSGAALLFGLAWLLWRRALR